MKELGLARHRPAAIKLSSLAVKSDFIIDSFGTGDDYSPHLWLRKGQEIGGSRKPIRRAPFKRS